MAITDTSPTETSAASSATPAISPTEATRSVVPTPGGLAGVIGTGDHKTLGRLYIGFSLVFGTMSLGLWAWFGIDAAGSVHSDRSFLAFTLAQLGLVFLFLVPLFVGLATAIVPLQVGANTIAFPRAAAAAFWTWLLASGLLCVSYLPALDGGFQVNGGDVNGESLTLLALAGVIIGLLLATVCIMTTVITLRPTGMGLDRVPLFAWSMVVAGTIWLLTLPVFLANLALVYVDRKYGAPALFGVSFRQWQQLSWIVTQPQVFAFAIPALGITADAVATFSRGRQPHRGGMQSALGIFGALAFGAYAQVFFNPAVYLQAPFKMQSFLIALPVLILLGGFVDALRRGKPKFASPLLAGLLGTLVLLLAAATAIPFAIGRLGLQYSPKLLVNGNQTVRVASSGSPIYTWGVLLLVVGAATAGALAGLHYWSAKTTGKRSMDGLGKLLALVVALAAVLMGVPFLVLGFVNKSEGLADSANGLYGMSVVGAVIMAAVLLVSFAVFLIGRASVIGGAATADADAWGFGQTLEWACDSPPPPGNFGELADIRSPEPVLDLADAGGQD